MEKYLEVRFHYEDQTQTDTIIALLSLMPFDSIWEDNILKAYILESKWSDTVILALDQLNDNFHLTYEVIELPQVNWNQKWEKQFDPVSVGDFCRIRASFHPSSTKYIHEIEINPKMSFGTGHHETTYMMIDAMKELNFDQKRVLDYGSGTGILGILSSLLGASEIDAVEIEEIANENAKENAVINGITIINFYHGDLDLVKGKFDIVLANINRNVLTLRMKDIAQMTHKGGNILLSGILKSDEDVLKKSVEDACLNLMKVRYKGEWCCFYVEKKRENSKLSNL